MIYCIALKAKGIYSIACNVSNTLLVKNYKGYVESVEIKTVPPFIYITARVTSSLNIYYMKYSKSKITFVCLLVQVFH